MEKYQEKNPAEFTFPFGLQHWTESQSVDIAHMLTLT